MMGPKGASPKPLLKAVHLYLLSRSADKMSCQEPHSGHVVFTLMATLATGASRLAIDGPWERIAVLAVYALRDRP